jgi:hypothetical protein
MNLPNPGPITIREVGTRDGIQSLGAFIETAQKVELVDALSETATDGGRYRCHGSDSPPPWRQL